MQKYGVDLLECFVTWIPHSTNDDTFRVLDLLLDISQRWLKPALVCSIIACLTDKYTVRSGLRDSSETKLVHIVMSGVNGDADCAENPNFAAVLNYCVLAADDRLADVLHSRLEFVVRCLLEVPPFLFY